MTFREMVPSDLIYVQHLFRAMCEEEYEDIKKERPYPKYDDKTIEDFVFWVLNRLTFNQDGRFKATVMIPQGNVPKGFFIGMIEKRAYGEPKVVFQGQILYIDKEHRHKGSGKLFFDDMEERLKDHNIGAYEVLYTP